MCERRRINPCSQSPSLSLIRSSVAGYLVFSCNLSYFGIFQASLSRLSFLYSSFLPHFSLSFYCISFISIFIPFLHPSSFYPFSILQFYYPISPPLSFSTLSPYHSSPLPQIILLLPPFYSCSSFSPSPGFITSYLHAVKQI